MLCELSPAPFSLRPKFDHSPQPDSDRNRLGSTAVARSAPASSMATKDPPAAGFTAVNGEARKPHAAQSSWSHAADRPPSETPRRDDQHPEKAAATSDAAAGAAQQTEEPSNHKRKRADVAEDDRPRKSAIADVSDREHSAELRGSSVPPKSASVSPDQSVERGDGGRISSPPRTWNKGSVPKQAQPETQALLAEQLASAMNKPRIPVASPHEPLHRPGLLRPAEAPAEKDVARQRVDEQRPGGLDAEPRIQRAPAARAGRVVARRGERQVQPPEDPGQDEVAGLDQRRGEELQRGGGEPDEDEGERRGVDAVGDGERSWAGGGEELRGAIPQACDAGPAAEDVDRDYRIPDVPGPQQ
nr:hypothetical protein CFP56_24030 [Quercus suber]